MEPQGIQGIIENYDLSGREWNRDMENLLGRIPDKDRIEGELRELVMRLGRESS